MVYYGLLFRTAARHQPAEGQPQDPPSREQHGGHLGPAGRGRARQDLDLEGGQLRLPRLHEDHELRRPDRHLPGQDRHEDELPGCLERGEAAAGGDHQARGHPAV